MSYKIHLCGWCGEEYDPEHGNSRYCSISCEEAARKFRQGERYGGVSTLLPILHSNHQLLESLFYSDSKPELYTAVVLEVEGLDFSLFRRLYPEPGNTQLIWLDFGTYYLETTDNFLTFKLFKNESTTSRSRRFESPNFTGK